MQTFAILATAIAALTGSVAAQIPGCPDGPITPNGTPGCAPGTFICGYELRGFYNQTSLECFVKRGQAPATGANVDGLYQCTTTDPFWVHACNNPAGVPQEGNCNGRRDPGPVAICRNGPGN